MGRFFNTWQQMASIPEKIFENHVSGVIKKGDEDISCSVSDRMITKIRYSE